MRVVPSALELQVLPTEETSLGCHCHHDNRVTSWSLKEREAEKKGGGEGKCCPWALGVSFRILRLDREGFSLQRSLLGFWMCSVQARRCRGERKENSAPIIPFSAVHSQGFFPIPLLLFTFRVFKLSSIQWYRQGTACLPHLTRDRNPEGSLSHLLNLGQRYIYVHRAYS